MQPLPSATVCSILLAYVTGHACVCDMSSTGKQGYPKVGNISIQLMCIICLSIGLWHIQADLSWAQSIPPSSIAQGGCVSNSLALEGSCPLSRTEEKTQLKLSNWSESAPRIWCTGPRPAYRQPKWKYVLPSRFLPLMRKDLDIMILPGGDKGLLAYVEFCSAVLQLNPDQIIYTSGEQYHLDDDVDEQLVQKLRAFIAKSTQEKPLLVPYGVSHKFLRWAQPLAAQLGLTAFAEAKLWMERFGDKGMLHRALSNLSLPSVIETLDPSIPVPRGYKCGTREELVAAYELLGKGTVILKPCSSGAGIGIMFVHDTEALQDYDFPRGPVVLEEVLDLDHAPDGRVVAPAVHYMSGWLLGEVLVDQIMDGFVWHGWRRTATSPAFQANAVAMAKRVIDGIKPQGPGGFDFLSVNGKAILTDINTGRFNGAHAPKMFAGMYAPKQELYIWNEIPPEQASIWSFWDCLQQHGLAFTPGESKKGVFPMVFLPGLSGQYIAMANTAEEAESFKPRVETCLEGSVQ